MARAGTILIVTADIQGFRNSKKLNTVRLYSRTVGLFWSFWTLKKLVVCDSKDGLFSVFAFVDGICFFSSFFFFFQQEQFFT